MKKKAKSARLGLVDLVKFGSAILIALLHFNMTFKSHTSEYRFRTAYILVEVFLLITGYFTAKHFAKTKITKTGENTLEKTVKNVVSYSIKKFLPLVPFAIIGIVFGILGKLKLFDWNFGMLIDELVKLPMEFSGFVFFKDATVWHNGPMWYLTTLALLFPFICLLACANKRKNLRNLILSFLLIIFYCGFWREYTIGIPAFIRIFAGTALGILVHEAATTIGKLKLKTSRRVWLQIIESASFIFILAELFRHGNTLLYDGNNPLLVAFIFAFFLFFTAFFSGQTFTGKLNHSFFSWLGEISMPFFLIHQPYYFFAATLHLRFSYKKSLLIVFPSALIISIGFYYLIKLFSKKKIK